MRETTAQALKIMSELTYQPLTKSEIFATYNRAKAAARKNTKLEAGRVNRALGLLQSGKAIDKWVQYKTDLHSCNCPDSQFRSSGKICKHRASLMVAIRVVQARELAR